MSRSVCEALKAAKQSIGTASDDAGKAIRNWFSATRTGSSRNAAAQKSSDDTSRASFESNHPEPPRPVKEGPSDTDLLYQGYVKNAKMQNPLPKNTKVAFDSNTPDNQNGIRPPRLGLPPARPTSTGQNSFSHFARDDRDSHPLSEPNHAVNADKLPIQRRNESLAHDVNQHFAGPRQRAGNDRRKNPTPGMSSVLTVGGKTLERTSLKGTAPEERPQRHPLVDRILGEIGHKDAQGRNHPNPIPGGQGTFVMGQGHGRCSEVSAISDYLHEHDSQHAWTTQQAFDHFHQNLSTISSVKPNDGQVEPPCPSCQYLTDRLGIQSLTPKSDGSGESTFDPEAPKRYLGQGS